MKYTKFLRFLVKLGKVLSTIVLVLCILGCVGMIISGVLFGTLGDTFIDMMNELPVAIVDQIPDMSWLSMTDLVYICVIGGIEFLISMILSILAIKFFNGVIEDETLFTEDSAKRAMILGVCAIVLPLVVDGIAYLIFEYVVGLDILLDFSLDSSNISVGIGFIIVSAIVRSSIEEHERQLIG